MRCSTGSCSPSTSTWSPRTAPPSVAACGRVHTCDRLLLHRAYLAVTSPTIECGKTSVLDLLEGARRIAGCCSRISPGGAFTAQWMRVSPTLLIDEAECSPQRQGRVARYSKQRPPQGQRGNSCRGGQTRAGFIRHLGREGYCSRGRLKPSLASRSIHIEMKRKRRADKVVEVRA